MMKKVISVLLLVIWLAFAPGITALADTGLGVEPGQEMPDFTVSLTDGTSASLSGILAEKELVVLNIFASWCGPCEREFPEMEEVYRQYKDRMEIVSVSADPDDTMQIITDYKAAHGLSFPMGLAGDGLSFLFVTAYPTTILIDRDGEVGFVKVGAFASREEFEEKVSYFLSPDYDGKPLDTEEAPNVLPYLFGIAAAGLLFTVIGRWGIFRKAGKKGWYSLIPFLSSYSEYAVCWKGWIGLLASLCTFGAFVAGVALPGPLGDILRVLAFLIGIPESIRLSRAFGKGRGFGIFIALPVFRQIGRLILGLGRSVYRPADS